MAVDNSSIHDSTKRGIWARHSSTTVLRDNAIIENGGGTSAQAYYGGVATSESGATNLPYVDMGVSPDPGGNVLCGNEGPPGFGYVQIHNNGGKIDNYGNTITNGACP